MNDRKQGKLYEDRTAAIVADFCVDWNCVFMLPLRILEYARSGWNRMDRQR